MGGTTRGHSGNDPRHTSGRKDLGGRPSTGAVPYSDSGDYLRYLSSAFWLNFQSGLLPNKRPFF